MCQKQLINLMIFIYKKCKLKQISNCTKYYICIFIVFMFRKTFTYIQPDPRLMFFLETESDWLQSLWLVQNRGEIVHFSNMNFFIYFLIKKRRRKIIMMLFGTLSNSKCAQNNHILNQSLMAICLQFVSPTIEQKNIQNNKSNVDK